MKESFDPLAEAERRSDPQLVRYNETIGHDPSANADYAAYLRTRDFEDANGYVHDAKTSKFKSRGGEGDIYETDLINSAHTEALEENALRDSSLDSLAKKVAEARSSGDAQAAAHAEDLFFDKFTKLSEKYGWEEDDDSANDNHRVIKDAPINRTTIDDRLARYSKIMYGEEADTAVKSSEPVVESEKPAAAEEVADETDHLEKGSTSEPEVKSEATPVAKEKAFDVDAEVAQAKERLHELAGEREQRANEQLYGTEAAKADRELLVSRVSKEGLELDDEASEERAGANGELRSNVSKEGLELDDESTSEQAKSGRVKRAWKSFSDAFDRASTTLGYGLTKVSYKALHRGGQKEGETAEEYEARQHKYGRRLILGTIAVASAALTVKLASDIDLSDSNAHASGNANPDTKAITEAASGGSRSGGVETVTQQFSNDSLRVDRGEGLFQTFQEMGIPKNKWQEVLNQSGPKLVRMGEAYNDPSIGGFGLKGDGRLSGRALGVIADTARNVK